MSESGAPKFAGGIVSQGLIDRIKNIIMKPAAEWQTIESESATPQSIYMGYVAILAAIGPIAGFIGRSLIGISIPFVGTYRVPIVTGVIWAVVMYALTFAGVFIVSFIVDALAPTFGGQKDSLRALKVTAYSFTASWLAAVFQIVPMLGWLGLLGLYSLYLLYLGLPVLMRSPKDKAIGYTVVVCICAIVAWVIIGAISGAVIGSVGAYSVTGSLTQQEQDAAATNTASSILSGLFGGQSAADRERVANSLASLQKMGEQAQQAENAARANGSNSGAAGASQVDVGKALGAIGTIVTGGNQTKPVDFHKLRDMLPASLPGMKRDSTSGESNAAMGMAASNATAHYSNGSGGDVSIEITDMGTLSGLAGFAAKFDPNMERETDTGYERTTRINGQLVHEQYDNSDRSGEVDIIAQNRFSVAIKGNGVDMNYLTGALGQIDFSRFSTLAAAGK